MLERRPNIQEDYYPGSSDYPKHKKTPDLPNFFDAAYQGLNPEQQIILKDLVQKWRSAKGQGKRVYTEELKLTLREFGVWRDAAFDFLNEVKRPSVKKEVVAAAAAESEEKMSATKAEVAIPGQCEDASRSIQNILSDADGEDDEGGYPQEQPSVIGSRRSVVNEFRRDFESKTRDRLSGMPHGRVRHVEVKNGTQVQHIGKRGPQKPRYKDHRSLDGRLSADDQKAVKRFEKSLEIERLSRPVRKKPLREALPIFELSSTAELRRDKPIVEPKLQSTSGVEQKIPVAQASASFEDADRRQVYLDPFLDRPHFLRDARKAWGSAGAEVRRQTASTAPSETVLPNILEPEHKGPVAEQTTARQNFLDKLTSPLKEFLERLRGREVELHSKEAREKEPVRRFRIHVEYDPPLKFSNLSGSLPDAAERADKRKEFGEKLGITEARYGTPEDKLLSGLTDLMLFGFTDSKDFVYYGTEGELKKICAKMRDVGFIAGTEELPLSELDPDRTYKLVVQGISPQGLNRKISYIKTIRDVLRIPTLEAKEIVDLQVAMEKSTQHMPTELPGSFAGARVRSVEEALLAAGAKSVQVQPVS